MESVGVYSSQSECLLEYMRALELRLIGKPALMLDGAAVAIRPRAIFELFAVIVTAGRSGISRTAATSRLWQHLLADGQRQQLRIALHKLRMELARLGIAESFDLATEDLRFLGQGRIDFLSFDPRTLGLEQLERACMPFADGWPEDHWQTERDALGELVAEALESHIRSLRDRAAMCALLNRATEAYPTTARIYVLLIRLLRSEGREAELNEVVIAFEERWADRFGTGDIPDLLGKIAVGHAPGESRAIRTSRTPAWATVAAVILSLVVLAVIEVKGRRASRSDFVMEPQTQSSTTPLQQREASRRAVAVAAPTRLFSTSFQGEWYSVIEFNIDGPASMHVGDFLRTSDGSYLLTVGDGNSEQILQISPTGSLMLHNTPDLLHDEGSGFAVYESREDGSYVEFVAAGSSFQVRGTADLPLVYEAAELSSGEFLLYRVSDDVYRSHTRWYLWSRGRETPIYPPERRAQVTRFTAWDGRELFGEYSLGKSESWRYHSFYYDLATGESRALKGSPVVGELPDGRLLTRPEKTDARDGHFVTSDDGRALLQLASRQTVERLRVGRQATFQKADCLGSIVLLELGVYDLRANIAFVDESGTWIRPFPFLEDQAVAEVWGDWGSKAVLIRLLGKRPEHQTFYLISAVQQAR